MIRRTSLPKLRERILAMFAYVFAVKGTSYLDFSGEKNFFGIAHAYFTGNDPTAYLTDYTSQFPLPLRQHTELCLSLIKPLYYTVFVLLH